MRLKIKAMLNEFSKLLRYICKGLYISNWTNDGQKRVIKIFKKIKLLRILKHFINKKEPIVQQKLEFILINDSKPGIRLNMRLLIKFVNIAIERLRYEGTVNKSADVIVCDVHGCAVLVSKHN